MNAQEFLKLSKAERDTAIENMNEQDAMAVHHGMLEIAKEKGIELPEEALELITGGDGFWGKVSKTLKLVAEIIDTWR